MAGLDPAIHVFVAAEKQVVDARVKPAHDELKKWTPPSYFASSFDLAVAAAIARIIS
jgi:hypothetical protein